MNQRDLGIVRRYQESNMFNLDDAYGRYSREKREAWNKCRRIYHERPEPDSVRSPLKVIGANTFQFSAGFSYTTAHLETFFVYITANGVREFKITEEVI